MCETPEMVRAGSQKFSNGELHFIDRIDNINKDTNFDLVLASGVLQYVDEPEYYFQKLCSLEADFMIIDRLSMVDIQKDCATIQTVPKEIYKASYPAWFFSESKWISIFKENHNIIARWKIQEHPIYYNREKYYQQGLLIEKNNY